MFLVDIGVALILAKLLGYGFERLKQPSVLGEILAGVFLGRYFLGYIIKETLGYPALYPFDFEAQDFEDVAQLGIIFLLFITGLETDIAKVKSTGKLAISSTLGGVFLPLLLGFLVGKAFGYNNEVSLVIGVLLTATSIGVTVRTMMDLGVLKTDIGAASLSSSVMDDILALILIILVTGSGALNILAANIVFFFVIILITFKFISRIMDLGDKVHTIKALVSISLGICFILSALAEYTLSAAIEGAFFTGLMMSTTIQSKRIKSDIKTIGNSLFIPLFFVFIGTTINLGAFLEQDVILLSISIVIIAIVGKVVGRGLGTVIAGFSRREALQMGVGSIPRMEVALVSMALAIKVGAIGDDLAEKFIAVTLVFVTVTTLITPPLLKWAFKKETKVLT